jgi:hypothetical protein
MGEVWPSPVPNRLGEASTGGVGGVSLKTDVSTPYLLFRLPLARQGRAHLTSRVVYLHISTPSAFITKTDTYLHLA